MATITYASNPFAQGSFKKVYDVVPASPDSTIIFNNVEPEVEKIISRTLVYHSGHPNAIKKKYLANAMCELEMQHLFASVDLAPRIYAIQFDSYKIVNKRRTSELFLYYIDGTNTVVSVYQQMLTNLLSMNNDNLVMCVLTKACIKDELLVTSDNVESLLEHIDTLTQKIAYHGYWFLDFKPANMCMLSNPTNILGLDFDKKFIIDISQINRKQYSMETICRVARTYMFMLAVLIILHSHVNTEEDANTIRTLVQTRHLKAFDILEMFRIIIDLEQSGHNLCRNKYNPLSMLTFYTLYVADVPSMDVLSCYNINTPINSIYSVPSNKLVHEYIKNIAINNVFGLNEYNAEKKGTNFLTNPFVSVDFDRYKTKFQPLVEKPQIPYEPEIIIKPMFTDTLPAVVVPATASSSASSSPHTKKYKPSGGKNTKGKKYKTKKQKQQKISQ